MAIIPYGDVFEDTRILPDWNSADVSLETSKEDSRIRQLYAACLVAHLKAATARVSQSSEITEEERSYSRRVLTWGFGEPAETRKFLCLCCDFDEKRVRRMAQRAIDAMESTVDQAEHVERAAEKPIKPKTLKPRMTRAESARHAGICRSAQVRARDPVLFFQTIVENEAGLSEAEISAALERAAALELAAHAEAEHRRERKRLARACYNARQRMAKRENVPMMAAE